MLWLLTLRSAFRPPCSCFCLLWGFSKVSRCKSGTISSRDRRNGYAPTPIPTPSRITLPPPTQRRIQIHLRHQLRQPINNQRLLRTEQRPLRIQKHQITVHPTAIPVLSQVVIRLVGPNKIPLRRQLLVIRLPRRQPVRDFLERGLNRLLILRDINVLLNLRVIQAGPQAARVEDRQIDLRLEPPTSPSPPGTIPTDPYSRCPRWPSA